MYFCLAPSFRTLFFKFFVVCAIHLSSYLSLGSSFSSVFSRAFVVLLPGLYFSLLQILPSLYLQISANPTRYYFHFVLLFCVFFCNYNLFLHSSTVNFSIHWPSFLILFSLVSVNYHLNHLTSRIFFFFIFLSFCFPDELPNFIT